MNMRIKLLFISVLFANIAFSQVPVSGKFTGKLVPKIIGSGDTTRLPFVFFGELSGLTANAKYKYYVRAINFADFKSTTTTGVGYPIWIDTANIWKYSSNPGFSGSQINDTFTTDANGKTQNWYSFFYVNDNHFTPGKFIYPMIIIQKLGETTVEKY